MSRYECELLAYARYELLLHMRCRLPINKAAGYLASEGSVNRKISRTTVSSRCWGMSLSSPPFPKPQGAHYGASNGTRSDVCRHRFGTTTLVVPPSSILHIAVGRFLVEIFVRTRAILPRVRVLVVEEL